MLMDQPAELTWGDFVIDSEADSDVPWRCRMLVGTDFGDPVPIVEFIENTLLTEGTEAVVTGWDGREFPVLLEIEADDGQAMSQAENTLFGQVYADTKPPLLWTPPMLGAWTVALDVSLVKFVRKYDGDYVFNEAVHRVRTYELQFTASTFVRDVEPIEVAALPIPKDPDESDTVSIDDCTSTASWSAGYIDGVLAWAGTPVLAEAGQAVHYDRAGGGVAFLQWDGAEPGSAIPYLVIDMTAERRSTPAPVFAASDAVDFYVDGVPHTPVAVIGSLVYLLHPGSFASVRVTSGVVPDYGNRITVRQLSRTDTIAYPGGGLQIQRLVEIEGAAPTGAALAVDKGPDSAHLAFNTALIYTGRSPAIPLRQYDTSSASPTLDADRVSGAWNTLATPTVSRVPVAEFTEASYDLVARMEVQTATALINWSARIVDADGDPTYGSDVVQAGEVLVRAVPVGAFANQLYTLGSIDLPGVRTEAAGTDMVEIKVWATEGGVGVRLDERVLLDMSNGSATIMNRVWSSEIQESRIEVRSPQIGDARYALMATPVAAGGGVQDISRWATLGKHRFDPGLLHVYTMVDASRHSNASLRYYRRYPYHPGPKPPEPAVQA